MRPEVTIVMGRGVYDGVRGIMDGQSIIISRPDDDKLHRYGEVIRPGQLYA